MKAILFVIMLVLVPACFSPDAAALTRQQYLPADTPEDKRARDLIESVSEQMQLLFDDHLPIKQRLTILFGAEDGPLFDPERMQIWIPYQFVTEVLKRFEGDDYQQTGVTAVEATQDALMHTLAHEYGHAFIHSNRVIVLGREEDAVDTLATLLLLNSFEEGDEIALSAADLFALEDEEVDSFDDDHFWDEHSLDAQRYFATLCLIYGSDPEKNREIISKAQLEMERDSYCEEEYFRQTENWDRLKEMYPVEPLSKE
ncbi:DUF4344 domain-containing metallopeptidase [uncultured Shewanella sp.]|uniref:DUF4344 domain-containing metallopeptidase n=1 Tax=uncultured Shewanella sp. TaxID=173975 RepID=UPI00262D90E4|nr:DUF4344 domain-containing metallopeptidase [uncultured Shewanella sp.]